MRALLSAGRRSSHRPSRCSRGAAGSSAKTSQAALFLARDLFLAGLLLTGFFLTSLLLARLLPAAETELLHRWFVLAHRDALAIDRADEQLTLLLDRRRLGGLESEVLVFVLVFVILVVVSDFFPAVFVVVEIIFIVEVFFVISGYLITLLIIAEQERTGSVDLRQFWIRRARRLLPALFVMM